MRNRELISAALLVVSLLFVPMVPAAEAPLAAQDPVLEARLLKLSEVLRCLVCQNQSLADSHAELASDLRNEIRGKMRAGMSDEQIVDFMVARYGDFVLYKPPVKTTTSFLWFGPFLLMVLGVWLLFRKLRKRGAEAAPELDEAARQRARQLLEGGGETR